MTISTPASAEQERLAQEVSALLRGILREERQNVGEILAKENLLAGDLVTRVDLAVQERLGEALPRLVPGSRFIGEEGFEAHDALSEAPHWIVDPLDGTLNFASGIPFFGASVALVERGLPILGVVYDVEGDKIYQATAEGPARENGEPFLWSPERAARAPIAISSGFLALMRADPARYAPDWIGARFRILGAQAVQLCWAASGRLKLNIGQEAKLWDDAAGALICARARAGYAALASDPLWPLAGPSPALRGESLFSLSGDPDLVARCRADFQRR